MRPEQRSWNLNKQHICPCRVANQFIKNCFMVTDFTSLEFFPREQPKMLVKKLTRLNYPARTRVLSVASLVRSQFKENKDRVKVRCSPFVAKIFLRIFLRSVGHFQTNFYMCSVRKLGKNGPTTNIANLFAHDSKDNSMGEQVAVAANPISQKRLSFQEAAASGRGCRGRVESLQLSGHLSSKYLPCLQKRFAPEQRLV